MASTGFDDAAAPRAEGQTEDEWKPSYDSAFTDGRAIDIEKSEPESGLPKYGQRRRSSAVDKGDPFGDEEGAEVKYRTMRWW